MTGLSRRSFFSIFCNTLLCIAAPMVVHASEAPPLDWQAINPNYASRSAADNFNDNYYLQRIHADSYYHIVAYSDNGDTLQLYDGSKWSIQSNGRKKVLYWRKSQEIFIKPNVSWFSFYKYVLYNRTTNEAVEANLLSHPLPQGEKVFAIVEIRPYERQFLLNNHTVWQLSPNANMERWFVGQRVFIGVNNKWRTVEFPHILINADRSDNPYVEASFFGNWQ